MNELPWIARARQYIGLMENTSKTAHNPIITGWLASMGKFTGEARSWWNDDETPWCGLFVGYCLGVTGRYVIREWYRARAWEAPDMARLTRPAYGAIVTFTRSGGGHVGFVVGQDLRGHIMVLGGNQANGVSIAPFSRDRVTGYRWPAQWADGRSIPSIPLAERFTLPLLESSGAPSSNES